MSYQFPALVVPIEQLPAPAAPTSPQQALRRTLRLSLIVTGVFVTAVAAMASVIQTSGAVIGAGTLSVESSVKRLAHPTGGVIAQLYVKEGERVRKGQPIMRFDDTVSGGSANLIGQSLEQLLAARARLNAERDGLAAIAFPEQLTANPSPSATSAMEEARRQFSLNRQMRAAERATFAARISQAQQEIAAIGAQRSAAAQQADLIKPELNAMRTLYDRKLVTLTRLNQMERTAAELGGTVSAYGSNIAQSRARIAEIQQASLEAQQNARTQAARELAEVSAQLNDQRIRSIASTDAADRTTLRAPSDGVIEKLAFTTVGEVVPPAQPIAEIVPDHEPLIVDVKVSPNDVDQIYPGQGATVRFSGLNRQTTPELHGRISRISAEQSVDQRTGASYFTVKVRVPDSELKRLDGTALKPGMPAETYLETGSRSLMSYLFKPLTDQFSRAFRE